MSNERATASMRKLFEDGGPFDYDRNHFRLAAGVMRALAEGRPAATNQIVRLASEAGIAPDEADAFLRPMTERDADDNIVGAYGLSLNEYPHQFIIDGARLSTYCAGDALFMPAVLGRTAVVESPSPLSGRTVRLRLSPRQVEEIDPAGAVLTLPVVDPETLDTSCLEAVQGALCHPTLFFASREEAEQWAAGRDDIEILSVAEGYELGRIPAARFLADAA